jgi:hypothetical protein
MAAASPDALACADPAANPSAPNPVFARMFFPDHQARLVHRDLPVRLDAACTDDLRPVHLDLVDALADLDAGRFAAVGFLELYPAPVPDSPCASA